MIQYLLIILNLFILESLLSVDNAAVLAVMVKKLPPGQSKKALRYGMIGAYAARGLCLLIASWLVKVLWLKALGGLYLIYLTISHWTKATDNLEEDVVQEDSKVFGFVRKYLKLNIFWSTVILVEVMDLAFSIDNIFAAVALSKDLWVIIVGVFIGIAAMRFVAGWFLNLMQKHPSLEQSAYIVILLLGLKLIISSYADYFNPDLKKILDKHTTDMIFSGCMMAIFFLPLLKKKTGEEDSDEDEDSGIPKTARKYV